LRYALLGLDIVARKTGRLMVFQIMTVPSGKAYEETRGLGILELELMRHPGWSKLAFIEHRLTDNPLCITPWDHGDFEATTGQCLAMVIHYSS
jgi:tRNA (mo5U34)-methyltransferase